MTAETTTSVKTVQIFAVAPTEVKDTEQLVSWSRRSTAQNPVEASQRFRGVIIDKSILKVPSDGTQSKFYMLLQATIDGLADACFTAWIRDRMMETQMPTSIISMDAVLAFWAEEKQRATIDGEKVTEWLKTSLTYTHLDATKQKAWLGKLPKIAAPSYKQNFSKGQAAAIIAQMRDDDMQHPVAIFVATRCNNILQNESQEEAL